MGNAHNQFLQFERAISLSPVKKRKLIISRRALEKRIREYFKAHVNFLTPKFYIQGSFKMGTMVIKKNGTYDVDVGVYFLEKPKIKALSLQANVSKAVNGHTRGGVGHREKCIRVIYQGAFDVDLPVYYKIPQDKHPFIATKKGWHQSDPKELCDWFEKKRKEKDTDGQMLRLVKYFKAWANQREKKMPSGIALSVWVANHYRFNKRDDIAFFETAKSIKSKFWWEVVCKNPATPGDDFLAKLDRNQVSNFKKSFYLLVSEAEQAILQDNHIKASYIWRQQFGEKFPT
ncbi:hypothetical protein G3O08_13390 [Cryomorpha ignava]|uniref:Cyclic GMP-AMP synthase n=1 Tax=Cryomorpha ignava TaxID=101383 RepID=A0A7K3WS49_9FLAO|nr:hypothetical protein [Cryomorpha ignava]NEN24497.1 hypothetical protein [Cryomorpha ignava]